MRLEKENDCGDTVLITQNQVKQKLRKLEIHINYSTSCC